MYLSITLVITNLINKESPPQQAVGYSKFLLGISQPLIGENEKRSKQSYRVLNPIGAINGIFN
jgi:hypothetical protein